MRVVNAVSEMNGKIVVGPPKSAAGRRTVTVPASVVPVLREHVASFAESGVTVSDRQLVALVASPV
jgi:hypothetical protein